MRHALSILAFMLLSGVNASAQVAASPQDDAYCEKYYRFGAAGRLNCVLNSRLEHSGQDPFAPRLPRGGYLRAY